MLHAAAADSDDKRSQHAFHSSNCLFDMALVLSQVAPIGVLLHHRPGLFLF
jgi:hypothetical protein